jgi:hypothetical protein
MAHQHGGGLGLRVTSTLKVPGLERAKKALAAGFTGTTGAEVIALMRASVAAEFRRGAWSKPDGSSAAWRPVGAFGTRPAGLAPLGGESGRLARAWAGAGTHDVTGFNYLTTTRAVIGVRSAAPWPIIHRGGNSFVSQGVTNIKAKTAGGRAMANALYRKYKVWISPAYLASHGVNVPARPHATRNPALQAKILDLLRRKIAGAV